MKHFFAFLCFCFLSPSLLAKPVQESAIASAHPLATQAGRQILEQGGNAFDAAVTVATVLAVVEPYSSGLGGGGFFLLHRARDGKQTMLDARETAPQAAHARMYLDAQGQPHPQASLEGPLAAGIPGLPAGLVHLARHYGKFPLTKTLAPAIDLAENGYEVGARYRVMTQTRRNLLQKQDTAAAIFLDQGQVPREGFRLRQPDLAETLRALAKQGQAGFYQGRIARDMVQAVREQGGIWTLADLARYRVKERVPVRTQYRGMTIVSAALPSAGGITLAQTLNMLAPLELERMSEAQRMHHVAEALRRAYHDRARFLGDADFVAVPVKQLLNAAYLNQRAASIDPNNATPSSQLDTAPAPRTGDHTTHFSIVDRAGNRVAATLTINTLFGSGFVAGNTGVLLNNEMDDFAVSESAANVYGLIGSRANRVAPGKRPLSSMSPTFVEDARGVLILGTPGGSRIISMVLLAILNHAANLKVDLKTLAAAPRYHHQYLPDRIEVEPDVFMSADLDELILKGHVVQTSSRPWGNMQMVWVDRKNGHAQAASDPRGEGGGMAWY